MNVNKSRELLVRLRDDSMLTHHNIFSILFCSFSLLYGFDMFFYGLFFAVAAIEGST